MLLVINGHTAVLKKGSSFDFVSENRAFSDADAYTMSISLPLADCPENLKIFGNIDRLDFPSRQISLPAVISEGRFSKSGIVTVVEASDVEVKVQFLEGRSRSNFEPAFDNVYINELNLSPNPYAPTMPPASFLKSIDQGANFVALPWVNDSADGYLNNEMIIEDGTLKWGPSMTYFDEDKNTRVLLVSFMPYLLHLAKEICGDLGYTCDFSEWEASDDRHLVVCNTLPVSWDIWNPARALPHWTAEEFFAELENFLLCYFDINHSARHVTMSYCKSSPLETDGVISLDNVVDSFTASASSDDDLSEFKGAANIYYADRGDEAWKLASCEWLVDTMRAEGDKYYREFETYVDFMTFANTFANKDYREKDEAPQGDINCLAYVKSEGAYYLTRFYRIYPKNDYVANLRCRIIRVNQFGGYVVDPDSDNEITLGCVPAHVDFSDVDHGDAVFLNPSGFDEGAPPEGEVWQPLAYRTLMAGEQESEAEYYDLLHLAYFTGLPAGDASLPVTVVDSRFALSKKYSSFLGGVTVNPKERLKVSWLADEIPDVRAMFNIRGRMYLCEKITATFSEDGMSQLLKGEFCPVVDA